MNYMIYEGNEEDYEECLEIPRFAGVERRTALGGWDGMGRAAGGAAERNVLHQSFHRFSFLFNASLDFRVTVFT